MSWIFIKILNLSINASWLILALILLRPLLKKAPKWITCGLWAIVAVRLLIPFSIESALSILPGSEVIPQDIVTTKTPVIHSQITAVDNTINPVMVRELAPKAGDSTNPMQVILSVAGVVWIIGVGICLIYALISYLLLKKKVSAAVATGEGIMACDEIKTPFILGILRPVIYVPSSLSGRTLEVVLAHEKAHLLRRDHWWKPLGFLLLSVHWFNPLCLIAYILLCRDVEAACDEKVLRDRDKAFAADYSQALLDLSTSRRIITFCPLAFGESGVKGRVKGILNYRKPAFWVTLFAIVASVIVAVYFMTSPTTKTEKDANRTEPSGSVTREDLYGQYICEEPGFPDMFTISLNEDGSFSYYEGAASSYIGAGDWELSENRVTLRDTGYGEEWDFFFTVQDGCLVFDKKASHRFIHTDPVDGIRFLRRDSVDDAWIEDLEMRGWKKDLERVTPWDYPIRPGSDEWNALDISDAIAKLEVPKDIVDAMTTEALFETVINYPLIDNIFGYDTVHFGITATRGSFYALDAFLNREDAEKILDDDLKSIQNRQKEPLDEATQATLEDRLSIVKSLWTYVTGADPYAEKREREIEFNY